MYYDYFGLKQPPFKITPDTRLFYPGGNRGEILDALVYAVTSGEGIIKVVGEVGSGKTMLCRMLQEELPETVEIVYLANPSLSPEDILHAIAFELKLPIAADSSRLQVMNQLQEYLIGKHAGGQQVVVFVEEAQSMPLDTLEEIRFLSNLETQQYKLLQIVLFGQPELDVKIAQREIRQLKERITYSFQLNPFKINDVRDYLNTRLRNCGCRTADTFRPSAIKAIDRFSRGLVRRINILADKSLLAAYAGNSNAVTVRHVRQAARDSEFISRRWPLWAAWCLLAVMLAGTGWWLWPAGEPGAPVQAAATPTRPAAGPAPERIMEPVANDQAPVHGNTDMLVSTDKHTQAASSKSMDTPPVQRYSIGISDSYEDESISGPEHSRVPAVLTTVQEDTGVEPPSDAGEVSEALPANVETVAASESEPVTEQQILGLNEFFKLQDSGDARLTDQEMLLLKRWVENLPPEVAAQYGPIPEGETCSLCWTIIYRPLLATENL